MSAHMPETCTLSDSEAMLLNEVSTNKYKKQLNKLKEKVGMVVQKCTQTGRVGIINEMHPYKSFIETLLL